MTVAPATLSQMIAATRLDELRGNVITTLQGLLKGVNVVAHPGKLDMEDFLKKTIVQAPGVAVGVSGLRRAREMDGAYGIPVALSAFIITEDFADRSSTPPRAIPRDVVAMAIGARLLLILSDADTASWGMTGAMPPAADPEPELRPVFTMKAAENRTNLYAVTWTQVLVREGVPTFGGPTPPVAGVPDGMEFEWPEDGELPTELLAAFGSQGERP
ncbi:hypothetical protein [Methylobacterium aquaticum]|uniref:hypothetical protein n=1 Tax=Methylobacterium aquaticum TaxID=270351 RepID=UPI0019345F62|nr:hypothetical protein [Methylobacterium aquaticum]QRE74385.1 hypothetical protein F1D61_12910 [Methylobacterium aquaticum]